MQVLIAPLFQAYVTEGASSKASLIKSWRCCRRQCHELSSQFQFLLQKHGTNFSQTWHNAPLH